jgi:hypothetical protein
MGAGLPERHIAPADDILLRYKKFLNIVGIFTAEIDLKICGSITEQMNNHTHPLHRKQSSEIFENDENSIESELAII